LDLSVNPDLVIQSPLRSAIKNIRVEITRASAGAIYKSQKLEKVSARGICRTPPLLLSSLLP
jgi:hypothetical protein